MEFPTAAAASAAGKSRPAKLHSMLMKLKIDQGWGFGDLRFIQDGYLHICIENNKIDFHILTHKIYFTFFFQYYVDNTYCSTCTTVLCLS